MPQANKTIVENSFVKGLVTYATGMNFPEHACSSSDNMTFNPYGLVERRPGIDFESGGSTSSFGPLNSAVAGFLWKDVSGDGDVYFYAVQVGQYLRFYRVDLDDTTVSTGLHATSIDMATFQVDFVIDWTTIECQFAAGNGYLFVVNPRLTPFAVLYDTVTDTFSTITINIVTRDFDGAPDPTTGVTSRNLVLTDAQLYNLLNRGWTNAADGDNPYTDTLGTFFTDEAIYPSNADVWFTFKDSTGVFDPATTAPNVNSGNTSAPQGHFILNAFVKDYGSAFGRPLGITTVTSNGYRPSTVAFMGSRVFYSGVQWTGFSQNIYFSPVITTVGAALNEQTISGVVYNQFGACFQRNDPTSETTFELLPDDGGVIRIPDCGTVYKLWPLQNSLLVFASNGIWVISGSDGIGFTASSYTINKLSAVRCLSSTSFVDVQGMPMFWTHEGVWSVTVNTTANQSSGGLEVKSLTDTTIGSFYRDIPALSKKFARGIYDPFNYTVQWIYNGDTPTTVGTEFIYNKVLNFNVISQAWYGWTVDKSLAQIRSIFLTVSNNDDVDSYRPKYLVSFDDGNGLTESFGFADLHNNDTAPFTDWYSRNTAGVTYTSFLITGHKLFGEANKRFQNLYLTLFFDNNTLSLDPNPLAVVSSCLANALWDSAVVEGTTARGTGRELCRIINQDFSMGMKRIKIRGRGRIFQLQLISDGTYPMNIEGWSLAEEINTAL